MPPENPYVEPLRELISALNLIGGIQIPNESCAQTITSIQRGVEKRFICVTVGAKRVMWSIGHEHRATLHGDHSRGKAKLAQFVSAIQATIDRSFAQS